MANRIFYFCIFLMLSSCIPTRKLIYLQDLPATGVLTENITNKIESEIQPDDLLGITVSSLSPESNALFNTGVMQTVGTVASTATANAGRVSEGYLVDKKGNINFPVLGSVKVGGLTKTQLTDKLTSDINAYVKNAVVNVKFLNFRVTVIGEVARPSTFTVPTERINLFEALGQAGDMTAYGRRENVLIIREKNGVRSTVRVDLTSKKSLESPYYYLQQNDIVYVEPAKVKALQSGSSSFYVPLTAAVVSIVSILAIFLR